MSVLLMTGFPGFLGSALLPRLLARRTHARALLLVQPQYLDVARRRVREVEAAHPEVRGRVDLVEGDITRPGLGMGEVPHDELSSVTEVWHLAAVYDLATPEDVARRVNVDGTANILEFCASRSHLERLHYVSTCYVSGAYEGVFAESDLDEGQVFRNHYEETKFEAEMLVRKAMADGLPATVYRPGIVVGDSTTGATQKYDGPYFVATFLRRQLPFGAVIPLVASPDEVRFCLVPRDFVIDAMDTLSVTEVSLGKTYALTDPRPPTVRQLVDTFARELHRRVLWVPVPLGATRTLIDRVPGMERLLGLPAESLDYLASPTLYDTTNTTTDLIENGVDCPRFEDYAPRLLRFMLEHPEFDAKAMI
jgi:thioester reductase-like protein